MTTGVFPVDLTPVRADHGLWCSVCLLPSGVQELFAMSGQSDPTTILGHFTASYCADCGSPLQVGDQR